MGIKVLEIEGVWSLGIAGSLANITKVMNALDACEFISVEFHHEEEGKQSGYYAIPNDKQKTLTIKELPLLTREEFDAMRDAEKERQALKKEFEEKGLEPNPVPTEEPPCCMTGCAVCDPDSFVDSDKESESEE